MQCLSWLMREGGWTAALRLCPPLVPVLKPQTPLSPGTSAMLCTFLCAQGWLEKSAIWEIILL